MKKPTSMAAKNARLMGLEGKAARLQMAGPGHIPPTPQPAPKSIPPVSSFLSMTLLVGICMHERRRKGRQGTVKKTAQHYAVNVRVRPFLNSRPRMSGT